MQLFIETRNAVAPTQQCLMQGLEESRLVFLFQNMKRSLLNNKWIDVQSSLENLDELDIAYVLVREIHWFRFYTLDALKNLINKNN